MGVRNGNRNATKWRYKTEFFKYLITLPSDHPRAMQSLHTKYRFLKKDMEKETNIIKKKAMIDVLKIIESSELLNKRS